MTFNLITLFPDNLKNILSFGIIGKAIEKSLVRVNYFNPRDFTSDVHHTVDDRPFGGVDGMVMLPEILDKTIIKIKSDQELGDIVYLSPQGIVWDNSLAKKWATEKKSKTLICGRYSGIDQRIIDKYNISEISIGDYILSGGEIPAGVIIDSVARKIPNVLGNSVSAEEDSFSNGLLEAPLFTRPAEWQGRMVPDVLLSGNHGQIQKTLDQISLVVTAIKRKDLINSENRFQLLSSLENLSKLSDSDLKKWAIGLDKVLIENIRGMYGKQ
jgi:tRNA (guanine37-N1)-methyltransferase